MLRLIYDEDIMVYYEPSVDNITEIYNEAFADFCDKHRPLLVSESIHVFENKEPDYDGMFDIAIVEFDIMDYFISIHKDNIITHLEEQLKCFEEDENYLYCVKVRDYLNKIKEND